jgi:hypothetical protein
MAILLDCRVSESFPTNCWEPEWRVPFTSFTITCLFNYPFGNSNIIGTPFKTPLEKSFCKATGNKKMTEDLKPQARPPMCGGSSHPAPYQIVKEHQRCGLAVRKFA